MSWKRLSPVAFYCRRIAGRCTPSWVRNIGSTERTPGRCTGYIGRTWRIDCTSTGCVEELGVAEGASRLSILLLQTLIFLPFPLDEPKGKNICYMF